MTITIEIDDSLIKDVTSVNDFLRIIAESMKGGPNNELYNYIWNDGYQRGLSDDDYYDDYDSNYDGNYNGCCGMCSLGCVWNAAEERYIPVTPEEAGVCPECWTKNEFCKCNNSSK